MHDTSDLTCARQRTERIALLRPIQRDDCDAVIARIEQYCVAHLEASLSNCVSSSIELLAKVVAQSQRQVERAEAGDEQGRAPRVGSALDVT